MPFISSASRTERLEGFTVYQHETASSFGEVFAASVGQTFDENLSISGMLNREGWQQRQTLIHEKIAAGEIPDVDKYRTRNGRSRLLDYNRIAKDLNVPAIKPDAVLNQERREILSKRRDYALDVIERGSGMAQFVGSLNAYALDPINLATLGAAAPATTARATSILARAAYTAKNAALTEAATELGIQTLVYQHKKDIESPYSAADALTSIGMAATGAAVLGGAAGGLSAWLERVLKFSDELPPTKEVQAAKQYLEQAHETLKRAPAPEIDEAAIQKAILDEAREELIPAAGNKLARVDLESLLSERRDIEYKLANLVPPSREDVRGWIQELRQADPKAKARQLKMIAEKAARADYSDSADSLKQRLTHIARRLEANQKAADAEADLSRIEQGIVPDRYQKTLTAVIAEKRIQSDVDFLREANHRAEQYDRPAKTAAIYSRPEREKISAAAPAKTTERERDILNAQGIAEDFDADMAAFNRLENPMVRVGDEELNAKALIDEIDGEIDGLESVLRCVYG